MDYDWEGQEEIKHLDYDWEERKMGFLKAFIISLMVCLAIIYGFAIAGAENNPYLIQTELVLTLLALSLTGVLTRSKFKSLAAIICVPIVYYFPRALGIFSPWGFFTELTGPDGVLTELLNISGLFEQIKDIELPLGIQVKTILDYSWLIDVIILFFCTLFVVVLVTNLFTGWRGVLVVIFKVISMVFLVFFLFILPLFYYGVASTAEGVSYVGIGAMHSYLAIEELSDPLDPDINYDYILNNLSQASPAFSNADAAFNETKANLLAGFVLRYLGYYEEFEAVQHFIRAGVSLTTPEGLGEFVLGLKDFKEGLNITMTYMTFFGSLEIPYQKTATMMYAQNTNFTQGLALLDSGLVHFRNGVPNLLKALDEVQKGLEGLADLDIADIDQVAEQIPLAKNAILVMANVSQTIIPLVNGTYFMTQAFTYITQNNFTEARSLVFAASTEIGYSQQLLQEISQDIDETNTLSPVPYAVYALRDLTTLASSFVSAANHALDAFVTMADIVALLMGIDLTNLLLINWEQIEMSLNLVRNNITQASNDLTRAKSDANEFIHADYGPLNETFHPVMGALNESLTQLSDIVEDGITVMDIMDNVYLAVFDFAEGLDFMNKNNFTEAASEFEASIANAEKALTLLDEITVLDESIVTSMKDVLYGLIEVAEKARDAAKQLKSLPELPKEYEDYLDLLEGLFGLGFGSQFLPTPILTKSQLDYMDHNRVVVRTDKCMSSYGYNKKGQLVYQRRVDKGDWVFFNFTMIISVLGGIKVNKIYRKKLVEYQTSEKRCIP
ncbi:MAG: hypothetical protein ACE5R6_01560 [Candidatus Heimdallarchaeota archaeon]